MPRQRAGVEEDDVAGTRRGQLAAVGAHRDKLVFSQSVEADPRLGEAVSAGVTVDHLDQLQAFEAGYFSVAPLFGVVISLVIWPSAPAPLFWAAAALMALGVWLHVRERHLHEHSHEPLEHSHPHRHDEHHLICGTPGPAISVASKMRPRVRDACLHCQERPRGTMSAIGSLLSLRGAAGVDVADRVLAGNAGSGRSRVGM